MLGPLNLKRMSYFQNITDAVISIPKGMLVTLKHLLFKAPTTVQYPDRTKNNIPVRDMLPDIYRGFLKVDPKICTGCMACMRACPIACIKIIVEKEEAGRMIKSFKIDESKCMFCGLCVEPCPTKAIFFTKDFEGVKTDINELVFEHVKEPTLVYKMPRPEKKE